MNPVVYADASGVLIRSRRRVAMVVTFVIALALSVGVGVVTYLATAASLLGLLLLAPLAVMVGYTVHLARLAWLLIPDETVTSGGVRCSRRRGFAGGVIAASDIAAVYRRVEGDATGVEFALTDGRHAQLRLTARPLGDDTDAAASVDKVVDAVAAVLGCKRVSVRTEPLKV